MGPLVHPTNRDHFTACPSVRLCPFLHGLFVSWGATGWRFVINSRANIHVTIDCSAVLPFVLGVVTRQKPQFNGSVVLGADESPWPCGTPSWYTPPYRIWFWVSRRIFIYSHHNTFVLFSKMSVRRGFQPFAGELPENAVWETKFLGHSPENRCPLYVLYKISLARANFLLAQLKMHSHWRAGER